jgi:hypothetical protein
MQSLTIRLAKGAQPRYVLLNHRSHLARSGDAVGRAVPDPFSSAPSFDGWKERLPAAAPRVTSPPRTWLLAAGWRRRGLLSLSDVPRADAA